MNDGITDDEMIEAVAGRIASRVADRVAADVSGKVAREVDHVAEQVSEMTPKPEASVIGNSKPLTRDDVRQVVHAELKPIKDMQSQIDVALRGTSDAAKPGILGRLDRLEDRVESIKTAGSGMFTTAIAVGAAAIGGIVTAIASAFTNNN